MKNTIIAILLLSTFCAIAHETIINISGRHEKGSVLIRRPNQEDRYATSIIALRGNYIADKVLSNEVAMKQYGVRSLSIITFKAGAKIENLETILKRYKILNDETKNYLIKVDNLTLTEKMDEIAVYPPAIKSVRIGIDALTSRKCFDIRTGSKLHIDYEKLKVENR